MKIIAFSGWKRSGKDSGANMLVTNYGFKRISFADPLKDLASKEYDIPREYFDLAEYKEAPILHLPLSPKDAFGLGVAKLIFKECRTEDNKIPYKFYQDPSGSFLGVIDYSFSFVGGDKIAQLYWTPRAVAIFKGSGNRTIRSDYWSKTVIDSIKTDSITPYPGYNKAHYVISDLRYKSEVEQLRQAFGKDLIIVRVNRFDTCDSTDASERDLDDAKFDLVIENKESLSAFLRKLEDGLGL